MDVIPPPTGIDCFSVEGFCHPSPTLKISLQILRRMKEALAYISEL